jgi:hypothetical protein
MSPPTKFRLVQHLGNNKKKVLIFTLPSVIVEVSKEISDLGTDDTTRWFVALIGGGRLRKRGTEFEEAG